MSTDIKKKCFCCIHVYMRWQMTKQKQWEVKGVFLLEVCFLVPVQILFVNILKCDIFFTMKLLCKLWATHTVPVLQILIHVGFLTEESGDVFSPKVLKGGPLGEMVQWADILTALHVLGHNLKISMSVKELQGWVPLGGRCWGLQREFLLELFMLLVPYPVMTQLYFQYLNRISN